jgi:hypothetical protein
MPTKSAQLQQIYYPPSNENHDQAKFPAARYFQIHFEHLESQLNDTRQCLEKMQQQMADLYLQLSPELTESKRKK